MKTRKFFGFLMILASGFLFVNCTSDPIPGPPGEDGIDGVDGQDGQDGVSGTASCVACHNNTLRSEIAAGFDVSAHASGSVGFAENRAGCASCHGTAGFIEFLETGEAAGPFSGDNTISCNACHDSHRTFDFENDGPDYALRNPDPTQLVLAPSVTIDFEDSSNNCISCHQPRDSYEIPALNPDGTYEITSFRFGPHHGPQSTVLEGILGAEIAGNVDYPARASAAHRTGASCVACHMGPSDDPEIGGHSWNYVESNCIECHSAVPGSSTSYQNDYPELFALLRQVQGTDPDGNPITGILYEEFDDENNRSVYANEGVWPDVAAMAAWNYKTIYEDQSRGIHNPKYTEALLQNSIQAVQELLNNQ